MAATTAEPKRHGTRLLVAVLAAGLLQLGGTVTSSAAGGSTFVYTGHCDDVVVLLPVDLSALQQFVPSPPYSPLPGQGGKGVLGVTVCNATNLAIQGRPQPPGVLSDLLVSIRDPTGGTAESWYVIWQIGNNAALRAEQAALGEFGASVAGMTYSSHAGASPGTTSTATAVPWSYSPYDTSGLSVDSPPQMATKTNVFWQEGALGTIQISNTFTNETLDPLQGHVNAASGSPLATLLGSTSADGAGFLLHIDFVQTEALLAAPANVPEAPYMLLLLLVGAGVATAGAAGLRRRSEADRHSATGRYQHNKEEKP